MGATNGTLVPHCHGMITCKYHYGRAAALAYVAKRLSGRNDGNGLADDPGWAGQGVQWLGLHGVVRMEQVHALFEKRHPVDGRSLEVRVDAEAAGSAPWLTEFVIASKRQPSPVLQLETEPVRLHRRASHAAADCLEMFAGIDFVSEGSLQITGNMVAMAFDRCCTRNGMDRLNSHYLLFNLTYCEEEEAWWELGSSSMKEEIPSAAIAYREAIQTRRWLDQMIEERFHLAAQARLDALARQSLPFRN